jgi:uncharacterized membrane protein
MKMASMSRWDTRRSRQALVVAVAACGLMAFIGAFALWPRGPAPSVGPQPHRYVNATLNVVVRGVCPSVEIPEAKERCQKVFATLTSGADSGLPASFSIGATQVDVPALHPHDKVVLLDLGPSAGDFRYTYIDFQRGRPLVALAVVFAAVVVVFARWRGFRALIALVLTGVVLLAFTVPALLRGSAPVPVALSATVLIACFALYVTHGVNRATTVALAGTLFSLGVITLGVVATGSLMHLTGLASEEAQTLRVAVGHVDLRSLLIAGVVVGALGVLDDVTVTQVSVVAALRRADPSKSARAVYHEATVVGRDHIASTVNTLILTYAGAALPLLLLFASGTQPVGRVITSEVVVVEIVRMLVGSIGLVLSVPVTTAIAAVTLGADDEVHDHSHGHAHRPANAAPAAAAVEKAASWDDFAPRGETEF